MYKTVRILYSHEYGTYNWQYGEVCVLAPSDSSQFEQACVYYQNCVSQPVVRFQGQTDCKALRGSAQELTEPHPRLGGPIC